MEFNKPKIFTPNKNQIGKDWDTWKQEFLIYLRLSGAYENCSEEERSLILINLMGTEAIKAMEKMTFDDPNEKNDMDIMIMKFDQIFNPPLNEVEERYKFFSRRKREKESVENYVKDLQEKAAKCNFGLQKETMVMDMIICNMNKDLRETIFKLENITLENIIERYKWYNIHEQKMKELSNSMLKNLTSENVNNQKESSSGFINQTESKYCWKCRTRHMPYSCPAKDVYCSVCEKINHYTGFCVKNSTSEINKESKPKDNSMQQCGKCGTNHSFRQCPAYNQTCNNCFLKGHYSFKCKNISSKSRAELNVSENQPQSVNQTSYQNTRPTSISDQNRNVASGGAGTQTNKLEDKNKQSVEKLEDCAWCGLKHFPGKCQHNQYCTRCDHFPHNICFQCKKNPHDSNCYYKTIITLPQIQMNRGNNNTNSCSRCGQSHGNNICPAIQNYCNRCFNFGHLPQYCHFSLNNLNTSTQSKSSEKILDGFVDIDDNRPQHSTRVHYQNAKPRSATQYQNRSYQTKKNKKQNNDACSIS